MDEFDSYDWENDGTLSNHNMSGLFASIHPGIRSALILWGIQLIVAVINIFTGGTALLFSYPFQLLLYMANGALSAKFAYDADYSKSELPKVAAIAGFSAWILPAVIYFIGGLILGFFTLGIGFLGILGWICLGPFDLVMQIAFAAFGSWIFSNKFSGREDDEESIEINY